MTVVVAVVVQLLVELELALVLALMLAVVGQLPVELASVLVLLLAVVVNLPVGLQVLVTSHSSLPLQLQWPGVLESVLVPLLAVVVLWLVGLAAWMVQPLVVSSPSHPSPKLVLALGQAVRDCSEERGVGRRLELSPKLLVAFLVLW